MKYSTGILLIIFSFNLKGQKLPDFFEQNDNLKSSLHK